MNKKRPNTVSPDPDLPPPIDPDRMIAMIRYGLPPRLTKKRVTILGAGMAGLVAGSLLKEAGHQVTILEANTRVGGRVHTIREPFTQGNYFDAGAMRIPIQHRLAFEYINKFKLRTQPFIGSTINDLIYVNGILTRRYIYEEDPAILDFPLYGDEVNLTALELLQSAIRPFAMLFEYATEQEKEDLIQHFDRYSIGSYLRENPIGRSLSPAAIHKIRVLLGIEGFPELSFIDLYLNIVGVLFDVNTRYYEIVGGNDRLPKAFLPQLDDEILYGQKVRRIVQNDNGIDVVTTDDMNGQVQTFSSDVVITTIPFSMFRFIDVDPYHSFSYLKWKTIRDLHYVTSVKVGIEFSNKFWEEAGLLGGSLVTDYPNQFTYYPSRDIGEPGPGVVKASYSWGDAASIWEAMSEEERIQQALKYLAHVHGDQVYETFMVGQSFSWGENPFSGGCFAMYKPFQASEFPSVIQRPEQRVHFAGEHTSLHHAWIEGAIESGIRSAMEVNDLDWE
ncbi:flavin monoamine oxidase family protein [Alteribacter populi]|uniref:flavin monoamine oxidase family protein n=1 Tax=Alteribacter populi TaxID=2011011 RepID=UPI00315AC0DB